jgi:hypothetical protein
MPNHVTNFLTFKGEQKQIDELINKVKRKDTLFDFNSFYPMPKELKKTTSPARIVTEEEYLKEQEKPDNLYKSITQKMSDELIAKYGHNDWYDWSIENWGTKWNCYDCCEFENGFQFLTAWSTPYKAICKLSELFPEVEINVRFYDEDFGSNVGEYILLNGELTYENCPDYSEDSIRLAINIASGDYYYSDYLADLDSETDINSVFNSTCIKLNHEENYGFDDFPDNVLNKLLEYAIADEKYDRAEKIKTLLNTKN